MAYKQLVRDELSDLPTIDIASVVAADRVFDFTILSESLLESWAFFPFRLHAYALDDEAHSTLAAADLAGVEVHGPGARSDGAWQKAAQEIALIEGSGLDRCLVSDVGNIFVQETPELYLLLERFDFWFTASPWPDRPIHTNVWGSAATSAAASSRGNGHGTRQAENPPTKAGCRSLCWSGIPSCS